MKHVSRALIVALISISTVTPMAAHADSRFSGMFFTNGMGVLLDTGDKVPKAKVVMPTGHLQGEALKLPKRTFERFGSKSWYLPGIMPDANQRFAAKLEELRQNPELVRLAKRIAPKYNVDPAAVVASVLTELTFNNDHSMKIQNMAAYIPSQSFYAGANELREMFKTSTPLQLCKPERSDYWTFVCLNILWDNNVVFARGEGPRVAGFGYIPMTRDELSFAGKLAPRVAFLPMGMSFGPAQITLFRALMASEDVTRVSGGKYPRVTMDDMPAVQRMISELEPSVHIIAATLGRSIYAYRKFARVDISTNVGLLATIFNVGYEIQRATRIQRTNTFAKPENWDLPKENYFGYFANEHEKEIRALVDQTK